MVLLVTAVLASVALAAAGGGAGYVHPVNCLCRPAPFSPQTAFCSNGGLRRMPRCVASDVADLHVAYSLAHSVNLEVFVSNEFYKLQVILFDHNKVRRLLGDEFRETPSLYAVDLSHNLMEGPLPTDLFAKNQVMHHLDLSHNLGLGIAHQNGSGVPVVTSATLHSLDLNHCGLVNLSTDTPALQRLSASGNSIGHVAVETFASMPQLTFIDLSHNVLRSLMGETFKRLTHLSFLNLSYNLLEGPLPGDLLTSCTVLRHLDLSYNTQLGETDGDDEVPLVSSSSLQSLNVTHCGLATLALDTPAIQRLNASFNSISDVHHVTFRAMHNLSVLDLSHNKLKNFSLPLPSVRLLNLSNNAIERLDQDSFGEMPEMWFLDLSFNKITMISSIILPGLHFLNLSRNALSFYNDSVISVNASNMILDLSYNKLTNLKISLEYEELRLGENPFMCSCTLLEEVGIWLRRTADSKTRRCWEPKALKGLLWTHFLSNQYCEVPEHPWRDISSSSIENFPSSSVEVSTVANTTTPLPSNSQSAHKEEMKGSEEDPEEGMSAYNATMVALVVWGLVAYPCVVALRRASRSLCHYVKRHRSSVAPCVATACRDEDDDGGGGGGGDRGGDTGARSAERPGRRAPLPSPPTRPTTLALRPQPSPRPRPPLMPPPPSGYDVLQFEAPRFRTPLPHYQQVTPTPTPDDCSEVQPLCFELNDRAPPNVYVKDPLRPRITEPMDEPVYAEIYDVVRR